MKAWIHDILLVGAGFAAGAYFMHVRMRNEYQKFADEQIEDVRKHFEVSKKNLDKLVETEAQKKAVELISGPYRQVEDPEKPDKEPLEAIEIIEPDEFGCDDDYETSFLTLYADGVLAYDSDGSFVDDIESVVGQKALDAMGKFMPDTIHVRNHTYHKDYEVVKALQSYADVYREREEEELWRLTI